MFCPKKNPKDYAMYNSEQDSNDSALLAYCIAKVVCREGGGWGAGLGHASAEMHAWTFGLGSQRI